MMYRASVLILFVCILLTGLEAFCLGHSDSGASSPSSSTTPHPDGGGNGSNDDDVTSFSFFRPPPCHFSSVGFGLERARTKKGQVEAIMKLAQTMFNHRECNSFPSKVLPGHDLLVLRSRCGAEFWGSVDTKLKMLTGGPDPHFSGLSRMRMKVTKKQEWQNGDEAMFHGDARDMKDAFPKEDEEIYRDEEGVLHLNLGIQMQFQCPAYLRCGKELEVDDERGLCPILTAQVAAFAHEIVVFDTLDDYEAHNKKRREEDDKAILFADKSFHGSSMLQQDEEKKEANPQPSCCLFTGHVLQAEEKLNEYTGELYYWALVESANNLKLT